MKMLEFYDIDFDCPMALTYGDNVAGLGSATGNYFINMFSNGMAVHLESFVVKNCTFSVWYVGSFVSRGLITKFGIMS